MRKQIYLLLLIGGGCLGDGCQKVEMPVQYPFASEPGPQTELDQWLSEEFTRPYNIEVGYTRTPYRETDWPDNLPPNREKIRPLLEALKALWIVPFEQAGGTPFMKEYVPRQILLWGDVNLNSLQIGEINTSLGEAVLPVFGVDRFSTATAENLFPYVRMATFAFAKRLVQGRPSLLDKFAALNPSSFYYDWSKSADVSKGEYSFHGTPYSWKKGFFSNGAMESSLCDFAETLSMLVCLSVSEINECLNTAQELGGEGAKATLQRKMAFVDEFLWENFKIRREAQLTRVISASLKHYKQPHDAPAS